MATTRTQSRTRTARTATAEAVDAVIKPVEATEATEGASFVEFVETMFGVELPSVKRVITGVIAGMIAAIGTGYVMAKAGMALAIGALALSGSMFLAWCAIALGIVLAAWLGGKIGLKLSSWIISKRADEDAASAKNKLAGWFKPAPTPAKA